MIGITLLDIHIKPPHLLQVRTEVHKLVYDVLKASPDMSIILTFSVSSNILKILDYYLQMSTVKLRMNVIVISRQR